MMIEELYNVVDLPFQGSSFTEELFPQLDFTETDNHIANKAGLYDNTVEHYEYHGGGGTFLNSPCNSSNNIADDFPDIDTDLLKSEWGDKRGDLSIYLLDKDVNISCTSEDVIAGNYAPESQQAPLVSHGASSFISVYDDSNNMDFSLPSLSPSPSSVTGTSYSEMSCNNLPSFCLSPAASDSNDSQSSSSETLSSAGTFDDLSASGILNDIVSSEGKHHSLTEVIDILSQRPAIDLRQFIDQHPLTNTKEPISKNVVKEKDSVLIRTASNSNPVRNGVKRQGGRKKLPANIKKERKKDQNRTAALRYREKKKVEKVGIDEELMDMENCNQKLRKSVKSLEYEIKYMKNLIKEIPHIAEKAASLGITL